MSFGFQRSGTFLWDKGNFFFFRDTRLFFTSGGSVWVRCQTAEFFEVERHESDMVSLLETCIECALAVGATFVGISLFGVVSECAKEPWCLIVYIIVTIVFLLCQLIPGLFVYVFITIH